MRAYSPEVAMPPSMLAGAGSDVEGRCRSPRVKKNPHARCRRRSRLEREELMLDRVDAVGM